MKESKHLVFEARSDTGKGVARKLRASEKIPVVLYGPDYTEGRPGTVDLKELSPILKGSRWETTIIELAVSDKSELALMREVQVHPITRSPLHIDFIQLVRGRKIKLRVPVTLKGKERNVGVKQGGLLEQLLHEVEIEVLPKDIPEGILLDIAGLAMGAEIKVQDLPAPEGVEWVTDTESVVVMVVSPRGAVAADDELLGEEPREVEVVGKGKKKSEE